MSQGLWQWLARVLAGVIGAFIFLSLPGCGNTFRPIAIPIQQSGGDPGLQRNAIIISSNAAATGTTEHLDVAGDTVSSIHTVGVSPVHAILAGGRTWVANTGDSASQISGTLTGYTIFGGPGTSTNTVTLPAGACPVFMSSRENTSLYIADPGGSCTPSGAGNVDVVGLTTAAFTGAVPVGVNPVSLAETPNGSKIYVANKGDNSVTVINAVDHTVKTVITVNMGMAPNYVVASADSACVYVANQASDSISVINTTSDAVASTVTLPAGSGPTFLAFDSHLQRVYSANTTGNSISALNHNSTCVLPALPLKTEPLIGGLAPRSIAPLADGTRVYVANSGSNSVSVIDASSLTLKTFPNPSSPNAIPVGANPVSIAAAPDSSRVYVANHDSGNISIIQTGNDTELSRLPASSPNPTFVLVTP